jgi:Flp pilus assembly pilin Flp
MVEYALLLVLIAVVAAAILAVMGDALGNTYTGVISQLPFH